MTAAERLDAIGDDIRMAERSPEIARHVALDHGPEMLAALRAVLARHSPKLWYYLDGNEDVSYSTRSEALDIADGHEELVLEWVACEECCRIEDGPDGSGPREAGYANSDHPCPTYRDVAAALEDAS